MIEWSGSRDLTIDGSDPETRPQNVAMNYIMALHTGVKLPVGAVFPYAGCEAKPAGDLFLKCQGQAIKSAGYPDLSKKIGDIYTAQKISESFHVPDMRGIFIRGVNKGAFVNETCGDPEASTRTLLDGTATEAVGSYQHEATNTNEWKVNISGGGSGGLSTISHVNNMLGNTNVENGNLGTKQHWSGFAPETRPNNCAMDYYINSGASSDLPIGAVIATSKPLTADPDSNNCWALCDGTKPGPNETISEVLGGLALPQMCTGAFIRGTDDRPASAWGSFVDAERPRKTLSIQSYSTGVPKNWYQGGEVIRVYQDKTNTGTPELEVTLEPQISTTTSNGQSIVKAAYGVAVQTAGNHRKNGKSSGPKMAAEWRSESREFEISDGRDAGADVTHGTSPKCVNVCWYIKIKN